jgi:CHAT domain-containing protein
MPLKTKITSKEEYFELFFQAEEKKAGNQLNEAVEIYQKLLSYRLNQEDNAFEYAKYDTIIIERLADLSLLFGNTEASINLLTGLMHRCRDDTHLYILTVTKIAGIRMETGELELTLELLQQLSPFIGNLKQIKMNEEGLVNWEQTCRFKKLSHQKQVVIFTRLYYVIGNLLTKLGQYRQGICCLDKGIHWVEQGTTAAVKAALAPLKLGKVTALMEKGEVLKAEQYLQTLEIKEGNKITSGNYIGWLELKAKIQMLKGNFGEALEYLEQVITFCRKYDFKRAVVIALVNLAEIKITLNQLADAEKLLREAAAFSKEYGFNAIHNRTLRLNHLVFKKRTPFLLLNVSPSAPENVTGSGYNIEKNNREYLVELPQTSGYLNYFNDKYLKFLVLLADGNENQTLLYLDNMKQVFAYTDSRLIGFRLKIIEFLLRYHQKNLDAFDLQLDIKSIRKFLEGESLKPELWQFQRILSWAKLLLPEKRTELINQNDRLLNELAESLPAENRAIYLLNKYTEEEKQLAEEIDQLVKIKLRWSRFNPFRIFSHFKMLSRLNRLIYRIDRHKDALARQAVANQGAGKYTGKPSSWLSRILRHPKDRLTISLLVLPDRLLIVYASFLKFNFKLSYVSRIQVRELIKELHEGISVKGTARDTRWGQKKNHGENLPGISRRISAILHLPEVLSQLPRRINKITFVPDDSLNGFPFAALQYQDDYLIKTYAVSIGYESKIDKKACDNNDNKTMLMVPITKGLSGELSGAGKEVEEIKEILSSQQLTIKILKDEEADKKSILAALTTADIFHIACHGAFQYQEPDATGLELLNGEALSLRDILENDVFRNIQHATLSSCWAADHFILPGRWVISLPETLWRSGVKSILGCLWQVDDEISVAFMKEFYKNIREYPRDIALQKAQKAALDNQLPECARKTDNPYFWCGFNLYGSYKPLKFSQSSDRNDLNFH